MNFIKQKVVIKRSVSPKKDTMHSLIKELRRKKEEIIDHQGIKKVKNARILNQLKELPISKLYPIEFNIGSDYIKKILIYKQENPLLFTVGKLAPSILKKYPMLRNPEVIKSILIASGNPKLKINDINKLVEDIFFEGDQKKIDKNILIFIRNINKKNYGYLLD